jgi:TonB family protein
MFGVVLLHIICTSISYAQPLISGQIHGVATLEVSGDPKYLAAVTVPAAQASDAAGVLASSDAMIFKVLDEKISARFWNRDLVQRVAINDDKGRLSALSEQLSELSKAFSAPFVRDDLIVISRKPSGILININGVEVATIDGEAFFEVLLNAWLGSVPPSSQFKRDLVSGAPSDASLNALNHYANFAVNRRRTAGIVNQRLESSRTEPQLAAVPQTQSTDQQNEIEKQRQKAAEKLAAKRQEEERAQKAEAERLAKIEAKRQMELAKEARKREEQALERFQRTLYNHPYAYVKYPARSLARREQGIVQVDVTIDKMGKLLHAQVAESSGSVRLDNAALAAVKAADPFPSLPEEINQDTVRFPLPLAFRMQ